MKNVIIATGADSRYLDKIKPYLESVNSNFNDTKLLFYTGEENLKTNLINNFELLFYPSTAFVCKNKINCLQHGEFVLHPNIHNLPDETIVLFTDGDIIMQRPLEKDEKDLLDLPDDTFLAGFNSSPSDNLALEVTKLGKLNSIYDEYFKKEEWGKIPCYNTGVLAAKLSSWKKMFKIFSENWNKVDSMFWHYAKQQWLICYILHYYFKVKIMPYSFHTHGHYKLPDRTHTNKLNQLCDCNERIILLRHRC